jgi:hypothetical protein
VAIKTILIVGVVVLALFVAGVVLGSCNNTPSSPGTQTAEVQMRFDALLSKPLQTQEINDSNACLTQAAGCRIQSTRSFGIEPSDDHVRQVRRATLALLPGSTPGATLTARFDPANDDPTHGLVQSQSTPAPTPTPPPGRPPPERARIQLNVSREGGKVTVACGPPNVICLVKLVPD